MEPLHAHEMLRELKTLFAQQAEHELLQTTRDFHSCRQEERQSVSSYVLKIKGYIDNLERLGHPNYNMHSMEKTVNELHAMLKLHEQTLPKNNAPALNAIRAGKVQKGNKHKKSQSQTAARGKNHGKGKNKQAYAPKPKIPPPPKRKITQRTKSIMSIYETGCGTHICNTTHGLRASRKLKPTALSLYVGNGQREAVEAIGAFYLCLPSGLEIILNNCHYAPSITRGVSSVSRLKAPKLSYLKVWGCEALVKRDTLTKPDKLEPRSIKCIFVGYPKETLGYSFYYPPKNKVFVARNAEFLENSLINQEASGSLEDLKIIQEEDTHPSIDTSINLEEDDLEIDEPQSDIVPIRRSTWTRHAPDRMCLYIDAEEHELGDLGEPTNYKAALLDQSLKNGLIKWLFKKKTDMDGNIHTYKAPIVAKGYTQTPGIDYEETFSPVADIRAIRILIAIAAYYDYEIWQMDVKTAFLNGYLNEEVYMEQPEGFVNLKYPNHVCKLKRSIYGLKQASRQWNKRFDDEICFTQNRDEPCVYLKASGSNTTFLILYVDDILIMGNNIPMLQSVKTYLGRCFAMKDLGEVIYILGIKIYRDRSRRLIGLCQSAYIEKILKRYCMKNSNRESIPMQEKLKLSKSQGASAPAELKRMQNVPYASAVGFITYAVRCTLPDVAFAQNTGYMFVLNGGAFDLKNAKQSIFATSSAEAECIAAFDASKEAVWVRKFISRLGVVPTIEEPISMYCDNTEAIAIANESVITKGARHFRAKVHYL
nr:hypothetical protein [Tanacetum cinerariifolium]